MVVRPLTFLTIALLAAGCATLDTRGMCAFSRDLERDGWAVRVALPRDESCAGGSIDIQVLAPTPDAAPVRIDREGVLSGVWLVDLDLDGGLELVLATAGTRPGDPSALRWFALTATTPTERPLAAFPPPGIEGGRGFTVFSVEDGDLRGGWVEGTEGPSGSGNETLRVWRYDFGTDRWLPMAPGEPRTSQGEE